MEMQSRSRIKKPDALQRITGSGVIVDEPGARISYRVDTADADNKIQFVLETAANIKKWKSLDLFVNVNGQFIHSKRTETKDSKHVAETDYFDDEMTDAFKIEFWKFGFLGFGAFVTSLILDSYENLGSRIVFTWERD